MPKDQEKGRLDYSKFDNADSETLEAYLRADFDAPEDEQMEPDEVFYILNLLAQRRQENPDEVQRETAEALERFNMLDDLQSLYDFYDDFGRDADKVKPEKGGAQPKLRKSWRRVAGVAVVLVFLLGVGTVTASAWGYNPFAAIGRWNEETFWFEGNDAATAELAATVAEYAPDIDLVPKWLPDGYKTDEIEVIKSDSIIKISADFYRETDSVKEELFINYKIYFSDNKVTFYEKNDIDVLEYWSNSIKHYIVENLGVRTIAWQNENCEMSIKGKISLDDVYKIINSIYEE